MLNWCSQAVFLLANNGISSNGSVTKYLFTTAETWSRKHSYKTNQTHNSFFPVNLVHITTYNMIMMNFLSFSTLMNTSMKECERRSIAFNRGTVSFYSKWGLQSICTIQVGTIFSVLEHKVQNIILHIKPSLKVYITLC